MYIYLYISLISFKIERISHIKSFLFRLSFSDYVIDNKRRNLEE